VAESLPESESRIAWQELRNKLEAFERFRAAACEPGPGIGPALRRASAMPAYERLWTLEGLGHALGGAAWREPRGLLRSGVPAAAALPLHTGAGLAFAERAVEAEEEGLTEELLERFAALCEAAAAPGSADALFEALGLAARTLRPDRIPAFDRALRRMGEERRSLFWHGLGRGLYFLPTNALPWGDPAGRALPKALSEPPDALSRHQAVGGLSWALVLVNLRNPEVVEAFLRSPGCPGPYEGAFAHGAAMAALVWAAVIGPDATLDRFLRHRPRAAWARTWQRLVAEPCAQAVQEAGTRRLQGWGELFRVQERR
jgi:hypothetical protein